MFIENNNKEKLAPEPKQKAPTYHSIYGERGSRIIFYIEIKTKSQ